MGGETPHGARSGCALTLAWLGIEDEEIKDHVGWKSDDMLEHYMQGQDLSNKSKTAKVLSGADSDMSALEGSLNRYKDYRHFQCIV